MAGWDAHLNLFNSALAGSNVKGAIFGLDGTQWAGFNQFRPDTAEIKPVIDFLAGRTSDSALRAKGVTMNGVKFMVIKADKETDTSIGEVVLKNGVNGAAFIKSAKAIEAARYNENQVVPGRVLIGLEHLRDHMLGIGFELDQEGQAALPAEEGAAACGADLLEGELAELAGPLDPLDDDSVSLL